MIPRKFWGHLMSTQAREDDEKLYGWESIASYLGCSAKTARKRERENALPVHSDGGGPERRRVFAYAGELDAWQQQQDHASLVAEAEAPAVDAVKPEDAAPLPASRHGKPVRLIVGASLLFLALVLVFACVSRVPELKNFSQLTSNNLEKNGIVISGQTIYFGQEFHGHLALTAMPTSGGAQRTFWAPPTNVTPVSVSPDGRILLALTAASTEEEHQLWVVPLGQGVPYRLGALSGQAAALSPDGQTVALATGSRIVLSNLKGDRMRTVASFATMPSGLSWSSRGDRLRCFLVDAQRERNFGWAEISGANWDTVAIHPIAAEFEGTFSNALLPGGEDQLTMAGGKGGKNSEIAWLHFGRLGWHRFLRVTPLQNLFGFMSGLSYASSPARIFLLLQQRQREPILRFDAGAQKFSPFLPGTDAMDLDYARDGQWLAYTTLPDKALWISRADGSEKRRITAAPDRVDLPRWSPDGAQLAFTMKTPGKSWRIYIVNRATGVMHEAVQGTDSQGGPTWSPDGRFLYYGTVHCEYLHNCMVRRMDLIAGTTETVPGSENLYTARLSPDGFYLAALNTENHDLMLYEVVRRRWRVLASDLRGTDLSWSRDSQTLYASDLGAHVGIVAIHVSDGQRHTVVDMHAIDQLNLSTPQDMTFSLAPDNAVLLRHRTAPYEIYMYELHDGFAWRAAQIQQSLEWLLNLRAVELLSGLGRLL